MANASRAQFVAGAAAATVLVPNVIFAQAAVKIRFAGVPTDDLTPVFWAIEQGIYKKAGLDVEFIPTGSGTAATQAVISGTYELAKSSPLSSCAAYLKGIPVTIVGNGALWEDSNRWAEGVMAQDSNFKTGADLNGKTAAAAGLNDLAQLAIVAWVDKNGGDSKTMKWIELPNSASPAAVADHRIATVQLNEPFLSAAVESKQVKRFAPFLNAVSTYFASTCYLGRPDWVKQNAALVNRFVKLTYETGAYTNSHASETAPFMAEKTKMPLEVIRKVTRAHGATTSDPALLQPMIDVAAKYGQLTRSFPAKEICFGA
jgi:NitT/TauT family transport system substrate-binding protein